MATTQNLLISLAGAAILCSAVLFLRGRIVVAVVTLMAGALVINVWAARLDPFLNDWDERYHALVARNMVDAPLRPALRADPVFVYDYREWWDNHVWLHKQPLFLWQIAASFRVFGVHEWSLRLPMVLMTALLVPVLFRMGTLLANATVGYVAALLFVLSYYRLELVTGAATLEHNDVTFLFYITSSLWCCLEHLRTPRWWWVALIGVFSGAAVLTKWLVGLLVYAGWGLVLLWSCRDRANWRRFLALAAAVSLTVAVALPWQIYTFAAFPQESRYEHGYNRRHLFEQLEGHAGDWHYHIDYVPYLYGNAVGWIIPFALIAMVMTIHRREHLGSVLTWLLAVYVFFSVVATKMPSYVYVVCGIMYLAMGCLAHQVTRLLKNASPRCAGAVVIAAVVVLGLFHVELPKLLANHSEGGHIYHDANYRSRHIHNRQVYRRLATALSPQYVVMNVKSQEFVEAMFYSGLPCYDRLPTPQEHAMLARRGRPLAVFDDGHLPDYLLEDGKVIKLRGSEYALR